MSKKTTHFIFLLDKSSSMAYLAKDAVKTFNEYVSQMRAQRDIDPELETTVSLVTFNHHVEEVLWRQPVDSAPTLEPADFVPSGSTALFDGLGYCIQRCIDEDADKSPDDDVAYWLFMITDGEENSSSTYKMTKGSKMAELFEHCEKSEEWTLTLFGCEMSQLKQFSDIQQSTFTGGKFGNVDYSAKGLYKSACGQSALNAVSMMYNTRSAGGKFAALEAAYNSDKLDAESGTFNNNSTTWTVTVDKPDEN